MGTSRSRTLQPPRQAAPFALYECLCQSAGRGMDLTCVLYAYGEITGNGTMRLSMPKFMLPRKFPTLRSLTPGTVSRVVDKCKSTFRCFPFICILHIMSSWSTMVECRSETILGWDVSSRERSGPAGAASRSALWHQLAGEVPPTGDSNRRSGTEMRLHRSVPCGPPSPPVSSATEATRF